MLTNTIFVDKETLHQRRSLSNYKLWTFIHQLINLTKVTAQRNSSLQWTLQLIFLNLLNTGRVQCSVFTNFEKTAGRLMLAHSLTVIHDHNLYKLVHSLKHTRSPSLPVFGFSHIFDWHMSSSHFRDCCFRQDVLLSCDMAEPF